MMFRAFFYGGAALIGSSLALWTLEREPPVTTLSAKLVRDFIEPGQDLRVKFQVRRTKSCPTHIDRMVIDSQQARFVLPDADYFKAPGPLGDDEFVSIIPVPENAAGGPAVYRTIASYQCNLVHRWFWPVTLDPVDVPFNVRAP